MERRGEADNWLPCWFVLVGITLFAAGGNINLAVGRQLVGDLQATTRQAGGGALCVCPEMPSVGPDACAHLWINHLCVSLTLCSHLGTYSLSEKCCLHNVRVRTC